MQKIPQHRLRKIRTWIPRHESAVLEAFDKSQTLLDLASNDYLDLNRNKDLIKAAYEIMQTEGVGAGGSRLITGSRPIHQRLEQALQKWLARESVLLFPSGFQANLAAILALANRHTTVLADRLIHHSLLLGVKASGSTLHRYAHNDLNDLERYLKLCLNKDPNKSPLVITESLFSMEGTSPDIRKISNLCKSYGARLLVDEAHALGVLGKEGKGLCYGLSSSIEIISGTFGKAFGSSGAFLASNQELREHLIQTSGAFRYTTALAPPLCAAALAALKLVQANKNWLIDLKETSNKWRKKLTDQGWEYPPGQGPIIPLIIGEDKKALQYQKQLEEAGFLYVAIRPPTVPEGRSMLRLVIRRNLPKGALEGFLSALNS